MAAEKFLESREKAREEEKKTNEKKEEEQASSENGSGSVDEAMERYTRLIARHSVPDTPEYIHKREQMYLMVEQDLSDTFIGKVIGFPSKAIDMLRMTVFVTGEDFLLKLIPAEVPSEEQIREWIEDYMKATVTSAETRPANSSVEKCLDIMGRHMVRQQEIANAQITRLTEYIKQINEMDRDKNEREMHAIRTEHQKEREAARKQIDLLSDENFRLNMKIAETQGEAQKQAEEKIRNIAIPTGSGTDPEPEHQGREESIFAYRRRMKEMKRREDFIASVLGNGNFTKEQLAVIERVVRKNFTLSQLQKICDPQVKPENMELLEAYYERRQVHG